MSLRTAIQCPVFVRRLHRLHRPCALLMLPLMLVAACAPSVQTVGPWAAPAELAADGIVASDGTVLGLTSWHPDPGPPGAVILALHGFNNYSNAFAEPAARWAAQGIATYAYDQRGFGTSEPRGIWAGAATLASDLREATALVAARHPDAPLYLLGESMGAAIVLRTMAGETAPEGISGLILSAPAVQGWRVLDWLSQSTLWLAAHTLPWWSASGRGLDIVASDNIDMLRALGRDPLVIKQTRIDALYGLVGLMDEALDAAPGIAIPTLLLYGKNDELIDRSAIDTLVSTLTASHRALLYPAGYHMLLRDLQADVVIADVAAWIVDRDQPLPSGAEFTTAGP